jgi:glycosyltransferase involved in cell wall biosynthesis
MRRLFMTADTVGGVWQYATDLAAALRPLGVEPVIATLGPGTTDAQRRDLAPGVRMIETGLPLDWLAADPAEIIAAGRALASLADELSADIVQLNAPALAAGADFAQPVIAVAHSCVGTWWQAVKTGPIATDLAWRAELTEAGLRAATRVVTPSGAFGAMLQHRYGLSEAPLVVRNGRRFAPAAPAPLQDVAFSAGRLWDEGKNIAVLDRAAGITSVPFRLAGPLTGPNGASVELRHAQPLGMLTDPGLAQHLAARPVFVSSALYEPFGLAVLEAAQAGCALILSDIPTFRELWEGAARFVYPHDAAGFARAVEEVVADPELRAQLGESARTRASDYSVERMATGMLALYRALPVRAAAPERAAA